MTPWFTQDPLYDVWYWVPTANGETTGKWHDSNRTIRHRTPGLAIDKIVKDGWAMPKGGTRWGVTARGFNPNRPGNLLASS